MWRGYESHVKCIDKWSSSIRIGVMVSPAALQSAPAALPTCIVLIEDNACLFSAKIYSTTRRRYVFINKFMFMIATMLFCLLVKLLD